MKLFDFLKKTLNKLSQGNVASIVLALIFINYISTLLTFLLHKEIYVNPENFNKKVFLFFSNKHIVSIGFSILFIIIDTLLQKIYID